MKRIFLFSLLLVPLFHSCRTVEPKVSVLHVTDLYRPYNDPDDHWDAACQFALSNKGLTDLKGVVVDYLDSKDPDVAGISQLNWITSSAVPVAVGKNREDTTVTSGLNLIRKTLEEADGPVAIHVVGGCYDIAVAADLWPELFREKVKAVYLNAGTAEESERIEWNVSLNADAYSRMFSLPCPLYWMPCFQNMNHGAGKNGTLWKFFQSRAFEKMRPELLNFFDNVLSRNTETSWLSQLSRDVNRENIDRFGSQERYMWCTAGFLHCAGMTVLKDGSIVPLGSDPDNEVFDFVPIKASCSSDGRPTWEKSDRPGNQFIFEIKDEAVYQEAMTRAICELMTWI